MCWSGRYTQPRRRSFPAGMQTFGRLAAAFALAALLLDGALYLTARRAVRTVLRANLEAPAREKLPQVVESMRVGLSPAGRAVLAHYLQGCLVGFGASYAAALDERGDLIEATEGFPGGAFPASGSRERVVGARPVLELAIPVASVAGGRALGTLVLGFSLEETDRLERRIARHAALLGSLASALALAALLMVIANSERALRRGDERVRRSERLSALGQLAAGIAHEINNPIGSILGFAQAALRRKEATPALEKALLAIEEEARRSSRLVRDLLEFSRRDAAEAAEFSLEDALERALSLVEPQARLQGVVVERAWEAPARVRGEKGRLEQVFVNLAVNALDAMPRGGRLSLRTRRATLLGRSAVAVEVADTGCGIPEAVRERVFEPFFTTKESGRGTGLGLAIVAEIVSAHQGTVELGDRPGGGAVFTVTLPVCGAPASC